LLFGVPAIVDFAAEVGPEFLGYVADCVEENVGAQTDMVLPKSR